MTVERLPPDLTRLVTPRAIKNYAQALGWQPIVGVTGPIAVFRHPTNELRQLIVGLDETFDDYSETVTEAVRKLAEFESRSVLEVLNHLLLPPSDVLRFREAGPDTETGTLNLDQALGVLSGTRKMLLSVAHSVLHPQRFHPRLSRSEADQFVQSCRMGQTERGSFILTVVCPLDFVVGTSTDEDPFARQVTHGLMKSLFDLEKAVDSNSVDQLEDPQKHPLLSANLLESLLMLRPDSERASLHVAASWSKARPMHDGPITTPPIQLRSECFDAVEYLVPRLRSVPEPKQLLLVGTVEQLRGREGSSGLMEGEVVMLVQEGGETVRARTELPPGDYQVAGVAHLKNEPVSFRGVLVRGPRTSRLTDVSDFRLVSNSQ